MLRLALPALALGFLPLAANAYSCDCSTLSVTSETVGETTTFTVAVTGSLPSTLVWAAVGDTAGETVFDLGSLGLVTFCLEQPFTLLPIGLSDAAGDTSLSFAVPAGPPLGIDLVAQAAAFAFEFDLSVIPPALTLETCNSSTVALSL